MNGAESLVRSLIDSGVEVCFANPGTSEMHFVAALDKVEGIRCVLGLFEGVVTGAADGYARMSGKPAATLLHLGPGLGNGLANLHNARKALTPVVNVIGEHASWHIEHDAPLTADIEGIAKPVSHWVATAKSSSDVGALAAEAVKQANTFPGQIASLILPANTAWETEGQVASYQAPPPPKAASADTVANIRDVLNSGEPIALLLGGRCVHADALALAGKIATSTGATLLVQNSNARFERGHGRVYATPVPYPVDQALECLKPYKHLITINAKPPVAFFAYPNKPSLLYPEDTQVHSLSTVAENGVASLQALVEALGISQVDPERQTPIETALPSDAPLDIGNAAQVIAHHLPENAIIVDEAITSGRDMHKATAGCPPHDWLQICGGSIGDGFPLAVGAAVACPERRVIALQADGSGMYTLQALWTQAREQLNITTVVFANQRYAILQHELKNVEAQSGQTAHDMMRLDEPELNWVQLANGMGVEAIRVSTVLELHAALSQSLERPGPYLIEARL